MTRPVARRLLPAALALVACVAVVLLLTLGGGRRQPAPVVVIHHLPAGSAWTGGGLPEPRFLSPSSVWNTPVARSAPLDPSSRAIVATLVHSAATYGAALDVKHWSTPIYVVAAHQHTVYMHLRPNRKSGRVNPILQAAFTAVPLPADARPAAGKDQLIVVYQPSTDTMWESWHTRLESDGWHFDYGGRMVDVSHNPGYYERVMAANGTVLEEPWWGPSATSLPLADSVISFRDLRDGYIDHALALDVPHVWVRKGVVAWPAERGDGVSTSRSSIPEGARFRLDPSLDVGSLHLPPLTRMIALAAQRYGFIVRDGSSDITIDGQAPRTPAQVAAWHDALTASHLHYFSQALEGFPWGHLQLLRMSLRPLH